MNRNANCDGNHCILHHGQVRLLPTSNRSNAIRCRACFEFEVRWRRARNRELAKQFQFDIPNWESLEVYQ